MRSGSRPVPPPAPGRDESALPPTVIEAIQAKQPTREGQRNGLLFELAVDLTVRLGLPRSLLDRLTYPIVSAWHRRAFPVIRTKDLEVSLEDFRRGLRSLGERRRARPGDFSPPAPLDLEQVAEVAALHPMEVVEPCPCPTRDRLAAVLQAAWRVRGRRDFIITSRDLADLVGVDSRAVRRHVARLEALGLVAIVDRGTPSKFEQERRAATYRWAGPTIDFEAPVPNRAESEPAPEGGESR